MQRHPKRLTDALLAALVAWRDRQELASRRRRIRHATHEALVQKEIDRAYADARRMRDNEVPADF
jgi:hypothetical protein